MDEAITEVLEPTNPMVTHNRYQYTGVDTRVGRWDFESPQLSAPLNSPHPSRLIPAHEGEGVVRNAAPNHT